MVYFVQGIRIGVVQAAFSVGRKADKLLFGVAEKKSLSTRANPNVLLTEPGSLQCQGLRKIIAGIPGL